MRRRGCLRHSNVATTAAHYTDLKVRPTVAVGSWLTPTKVIAVTQFQKPGLTPDKRKTHGGQAREKAIPKIS